VDIITPRTTSTSVACGHGGVLRAWRDGVTNAPAERVLVTPNRKLWAGDGNSIVAGGYVDPSSASYLQILAGQHGDPGL